MNDKSVAPGSMADRVVGFGNVLVGVYNGKAAAMAAAGRLTTIASADRVADPENGRWAVLDPPNPAKAAAIYRNWKENIRVRRVA